MVLLLFWQAQFGAIFHPSYWVSGLLFYILFCDDIESALNTPVSKKHEPLPTLPISPIGDSLLDNPSYLGVSYGEPRYYDPTIFY